MENSIKFDNYFIKPVDLELEINYVVFDSGGYLCRLVPGEMGLELSKMDLALDNKPDGNLITKIIDLIFEKDA